MELPSERIIIITGHYGSGKSEFSLNLATKYSESNFQNVTIADLDIINPYFRSREADTYCKEKGIKIIASSIKNSLIAVPALSGAVQGKIAIGIEKLILDTAGDPEGVKLLNRFSKQIEVQKKQGEVKTFFVFNSNRPETSTIEKAKIMIKNIEEVSRIKIDCIINNSHLLKETQSNDIVIGESLAMELSKQTGKQLIYSSYWQDINFSSKKLVHSQPFPMELLLRKNWMS